MQITGKTKRVYICRDSFTADKFERNSSSFTFGARIKEKKTNMSSTGKKSVYVTRRIPEHALKTLKEQFEVTQWLSDEPVVQEELLKQVKGKDALFCLLTDRIDVEVLDAAGPNLKVITTMSVGHEHIAVEECHKRGIKVGFTNVPADSTAELTVTLLLSTSRRIVEGAQAVRNGEWTTWKPLWLCGQGVNNHVVGILGLGNIGFCVAKRLQGFSPRKILYADFEEKAYAHEVDAQFVDLDTLLKESDFFVAMCPLTPETKGMFNKEVFKKMKKNAVFINTSRGGVVNQDDLYEALVTGEIQAAGLDVTTPEPLSPSHPLLKLKNCVVLPHIGSATVETRDIMADIAASNIVAGLSDLPLPASV